MRKRLLAAVAATAFSVAAIGAPVAAISVDQCKAEANALLNTPGSPYYAYRSLALYSPALWDWVLTRSCLRAGATP